MTPVCLPENGGAAVGCEVGTAAATRVCSVALALGLSTPGGCSASAAVLPRTLVLSAAISVPCRSNRSRCAQHAFGMCQLFFAATVGVAQPPGGGVRCLAGHSRETTPYRTRRTFFPSAEFRFKRKRPAACAGYCRDKAAIEGPMTSEPSVRPPSVASSWRFRVGHHVRRSQWNFDTRLHP